MGDLEYKCQEKERPFLDYFLKILAIGTIIAFTAGYVYWASEEPKKEPTKSKVERILEQHDKQGIGNFLNDYNIK